MKIIVIALMLFLSLCTCTAGELLKHELTRAQKYMDSGKWSAAIRHLEKSRSSFRNQPRDLAQIMTMLAGCYSSKGKYAKALKIISRIKSLAPPQLHYEKARALLGLKKYKKAMKAANYYTPKHGKYLYMNAMWVKAQIQMKQELYKNCMNSCRRIMYQSLKQAPKGLSDHTLASTVLSQLRKLKKESRALFYEAREAYDIKVYGMDFAIYRKAREAHFGGQYKKARGLYEKIKDGTLKEAAICYTAKCFIAEGNSKSAIRLYKQTSQVDHYGLYQGEMLYDLIQVYYMNKQLTKAIQAAALMSDWYKNVERKTQYKLENINAALKREIIDTAPRTFLKSDNCGNLISTAKYPGTINNHLTSPWYLPNLKVKGELFYGFLLGEKRLKPKAAAKFDNAVKITKMQIIRYRHTINNLKAGLMEGSYLFPKHLVKKASSEWKNKIRLACFFYTVDENDKAEKLFDFIRKKAPRQAFYDILLARLGKVHCLIGRKKIKEAMKEIASMLKMRNKKYALIIMEAKYLQACIWARSRNTFTKAMFLFNSLGNKRKNPIAAKALLALAIAAVNNGKIDVAKTTCRRLLKKRSSPFSKPARILLEAIKKYDSAKKSKIHIAMVDNQEAGKVIRHRRIVVMPSITDWKTIRESIKSTDIIFYKIKFVSRNNCMLIRNSWVLLGPEEPSPPVAVGDEVCFVRAPVLFQKSLLYNMKNLTKRK